MATPKRRIVALCVVAAVGTGGAASALTLTASSAELSAPPSGTPVSVPPVSQWPKSTTPTTATPTGSPAVPHPGTSPGTEDTSTLTHTPAPPVSVPSIPCTTADLSAEVTSQGPYQGMGSGQYIVTITSTTSCSISGYPTLQFFNAAGALASTVKDGGVAGNPDPPSKVAVGPGVSASFLVQFSDSPSCANASSLTLQLSGESGQVSVFLNPDVATFWSACPSTLVSPFEQGSDASRYA